MMQTEDYINMICFSMIMAAGVSILLLTIFRKKGKTEIPFVPFIFLAYMGGVLPVSYTHLDVYKRQVLVLLMRILPWIC